jgi:hypothetical protein
LFNNNPPPTLSLSLSNSPDLSLPNGDGAKDLVSLENLKYENFNSGSLANEIQSLLQLIRTPATQSRTNDLGAGVQG